MTLTIGQKSQRVGPIMGSQGNFTSEQYVQFFENQVIPYAKENLLDSHIYILQNNSRIHYFLYDCLSSHKIGWR